MLGFRQQRESSIWYEDKNGRRKMTSLPKKARVPSSTSAVAICLVPGSNDRTYPYEFVAGSCSCHFPAQIYLERLTDAYSGSLWIPTSTPQSPPHWFRGKYNLLRPPRGSLKETPTSGKPAGQTMHSFSFFPSFQSSSNLSCYLWLWRFRRWTERNRHTKSHGLIYTSHSKSSPGT